MWLAWPIRGIPVPRQLFATALEHTPLGLPIASITTTLTTAPPHHTRLSTHPRSHGRHRNGD